MRYAWPAGNPQFHRNYDLVGQFVLQTLTCCRLSNSPNHSSLLRVFLPLRIEVFYPTDAPVSERSVTTVTWLPTIRASLVHPLPLKNLGRQCFVNSGPQSETLTCTAARGSKCSRRFQGGIGEEKS